MSWRTGHGAGKGGPRIEVMPPDELPSAMGSLTDRPDRTPDGRFAPGNGAARARRVRPGALGGVEAAAAPFEPFRRWGRRYSAHRRAELARAHGGSISAGVGAIIESAALALATSRYLASVGAQTLDADAMKRAADLGSLARQHELAAWELAAREAKVRAASADPMAATHALLARYADPPTTST